MSKIYLAAPSYGTTYWEVVKGIYGASEFHDVHIRARSYSLLCYNFNMLWADAKNGEYEYFAMCHSDVAAELGWLDKYMFLLKEYKLDLIAGVIPIKNDEGLTSTGVIDDQLNVHNFHKSEIAEFPETFTLRDTPYENGYLAVNTGLWLCKLSNPVFSNVWFETMDFVVQSEEGFKALNLSEDWLFSFKIGKKGAKVGATTSAKIEHIGTKRWA